MSWSESTGAWTPWWTSTWSRTSMCAWKSATRKLFARKSFGSTRRCNSSRPSSKSGSESHHKIWSCTIVIRYLMLKIHLSYLNKSSVQVYRANSAASDRRSWCQNLSTTELLSHYFSIKFFLLDAVTSGKLGLTIDQAGSIMSLEYFL